MATIPIWKEAMADIDELLLRGRQSVGLGRRIRQLLDEGTPFLTADIDRLQACEAGDVEVVYEVSEGMRALLEAVRANEARE